MKLCPFCAEEIQDAAKVCKHCGRDLVDPQGTAQKVQIVEPKKKTGCVTWVVVIFLALLFAGWCSTQMNPPTPTRSSRTSGGARPPSSNSPTAPATPPLELLSTRGGESDGGGYYVIEGEVKNLSNEPMKSIQVVGTWYAGDGTLITSDSALIEFDPLMPGQTSPFKTMSRGNPLMKSYTVSFKQFFGGTIPLKDSRKK